MSNVENCDFCDRPSLEWRTIRAGELCTSFVAIPWFREAHCLVIPNRHIVHPNEILPEEGAALMTEIGKLSLRLDVGYGSGMMQRYQAPDPESDNQTGEHLSFHVFPREHDESELFPVPEPNNIRDGFFLPEHHEVTMLARTLRHA